MSRRHRPAADAATPPVAPEPEQPQAEQPEAPAEAEEAAPDPEPIPAAPQWTVEELVAVSHLGPAIIGREMYDAAQAYVKAHGTNKLGPATRGA